ncbi:MAG: T9SS type A sorting domain-containing protein [Bacteroidetes bacterium]|nr:T9SS type A sorting domain-containing protein [Bacteroidota bacterium]MBS1629956.1 T9SS type A sorting domain-containing protein [Bacteroidota bacterium]
MNVKLFPSPANDTLWLQLAKEFVEPLQVTVFDTSGSSCSQYKLPGGNDLASIPVDSLQPGVYFLQMEYEQDDWIKPFLVMR